ncbi:SPFH domain-containing protein [Cyanobacterium aponinum AL20118]|uniref:SPFH domain, Band 7 family protein n=3 Tax=Cyanobacterium aponinum TaxID=379064 RepID=K9Z2P8_CYAAP|nr:SPFH domain-containing protein [Cyanobacterium aponinum]AFZ53002.1 SPFH domain, Band 7 family protein [Cyanobacterium aponinum PCC 10605]MTF39394.1 paraslipin [Cyanobacterium aponinum 0216]PHV61280.1 SPFH/Band 7/PHB domain protein [Cyanobacterium aponinum IPPAS B-1201]WPF90274.1 SPFH domain-containing protein [Cyanobacterium aponinum AL20115]
MEQLFILVFLVGSALFSSVKIVNEKNEYLVERLGSYNKKLSPGLNFVIPFLDNVVYKDTIRDKILDVPPQSCITKDNVAITVDAVVYWRIVDMVKAYYKIENLQSGMENLVLTQIRAEIGKLELDETFVARSEINSVLLRELDIATDPWGVKVLRVELKDITPSPAVQQSMEQQMAAERKKRASILNSEGERDSAINSAKGSAEAKILEAESMKKASIMEAEARKQQQILQAQATAEALQIIVDQVKNDPQAQTALQFLLTQQYLEMGKVIGSSDSSKVMFIDPNNILSTLNGISSIIDNDNQLTKFSAPIIKENKSS